MSTPNPVHATYANGKLTSITIAPQGLSTVQKAIMNGVSITYSSPSGVSQQYAVDERGELTLCGMDFRMSLQDAIGLSQARILWNELMGDAPEGDDEVQAREEVEAALLSVEEWEREQEDWRVGDEYAHINTDGGVWAL